MNIKPGSAVISSGELAYIQHLASGKGRSAEANRKEHLRQQSKSRYKNWNNTLEAQREKKKQERLKRLEEIERASQLVDKQEQAFLQQEKKKAIDRANQIQYQESGRVKTFQSALLASEMEKQRAAQINLKKRVKQHRREEDAHWHQLIKEADEKKKAREDEEARVLKQKNTEMREMQQEQILLYRQRVKQEREEYIREGDRARELAHQTELEAIEEEKRRIQSMKNKDAEWVKQNQEVIDYRAAQKALHDDDDAKIEKYARAKEIRIAKRKKDEVERKAAKLKRQEDLIQEQYELLTKIRENEDDRVEREVAIAEKKREDEFQKKKRMQREMRSAIETSRSQQIARRTAEARQAQEEERMMKEHWDKRNQEMDELEASNERKTRDNAKRIASFLQEQKAEKDRLKQLEKADSMASSKAQQEVEAREQEIFDEFTQAHMQRFQARGKSIKPMQYALMRERLATTRLKK
jgi:hypothetical protein